jgi:hypothetical protein
MRRETLKIIGAVGTTCAFPFAADELYGQHNDPAHRAHTPGAQAPTGPLRFFTAAEAATLSAVVNQIIPDGDTPGAVKAGVPGYIDLVVATNNGHQKLYREGLAWLESQSSSKHAKAFTALSSAEQLALLRPLCDAADVGKAKSLGERFFAAVKAMTCDGYYTSKTGMVEELGFTGPAVLAEYKTCEIPEH